MPEILYIIVLRFNKFEFMFLSLSVCRVGIGSETRCPSLSFISVGTLIGSLTLFPLSFEICRISYNL